MKYSGNPWIGDIPSSWGVERIKTIFKERTELSEDGSETLLSVSEYYGVANRSEKVSEGEFVSRAATLVGYKKCYVGDLVSNIMLAWKGSMGIAEIEGIVSPAYCVYEPSPKIYPKYYHYLFRTSLYTSIFRLYSKGIIDSRLRLYSPYFFDISAIIPSLPEQQQIASFLDRKCAEIDEMIALQEKIIEELKEYKQSVITEAVTKGLNPDVPMKDSGIEWIGEIPDHWNICRLRNLGDTQNGISKGGEFFGSGYPFLSYSDIYKNFSTPNPPSGLIESSAKEREQYSALRGDVFFTRTSETIEEIGISSTCLESIDNACFAGFLIRFRPRTNHLHEGFSKYYFRSNIHRAYFVKEMNLVIRASLSQDLLKSLPVLLPAIEEQKLISTFLDKRCTEIDNLISIKLSKIDSLKEYKKSIIYEYVTGKKVVTE